MTVSELKAKLLESIQKLDTLDQNQEIAFSMVDDNGNIQSSELQTIEVVDIGVDVAYLEFGVGKIEFING